MKKKNTAYRKANRDKLELVTFIYDKQKYRMSRTEMASFFGVPTTITFRMFKDPDVVVQDAIAIIAERGNNKPRKIATQNRMYNQFVLGKRP